MIAEHSYGKDAVRLMLIDKEKKHTFVEWSVQCLLHGPDQEVAYRTSDNRHVIPTDTVKNTILHLAEKASSFCPVSFAHRISEHFLGRYPASQVARVEVTVAQADWQPLNLAGPHACYRLGAAASPPARFCHLLAARGSTPLVSCGLGMTLIKCSGSGFVNFHTQDELTTLKETADRVFRTRVDLGWTLQPMAREGRFAIIEGILLERFSQDYSPSLQKTLHDVGQACLEQSSEIMNIRLQAFNLHAFSHYESERMAVMTLAEEPRGLIMVTLNRSKL